MLDDRVKQVPFSHPDGLAGELAPYLDTGDPAYRLGRRATDLLKSRPWTGETLDVMIALNAAVQQQVAYVIRDQAGVDARGDTHPRTRQLS